MALHSEFFDRFKRTLGIFSEDGQKGKATADFLVKMNISPLMGRRNAAGDRVAEMMFQDMFRLSEPERLERYRKGGELLAHALGDTESILSTLTSPDTEARERNVRSFISLLRDILETLNRLCGMEGKLFRNRASASGGFAPEGAGGVGEQQVNDCEITLVNQFRDLWSGSRRQLDRYREYAQKSFSPVNAERYRKAYEEYYRFYGEYIDGGDSAG